MNNRKINKQTLRKQFEGMKVTSDMEWKKFKKNCFLNIPANPIDCEKYLITFQTDGK